MLGKLCLISAEHITPKINPYRAILRREYPDPLIALLCFILGIWLWDHYLNEPAGYAPGTEEIALIKIDRDLQLAEAMSDDHPLLRWLAHARSIDKVLSSSQNSLEILIRAQSLSPTGFHAYAVIRSTLEDSPPDFYLNQLNLPSADPDSATWWNLKLADPNFQYPENAAKGNLRNRSILVGSAIWLLAIVGVAFLPSTLKTLGSGLRKKTAATLRVGNRPSGSRFFFRQLLRGSVSACLWISVFPRCRASIRCLPFSSMPPPECCPL